MRQIHIFHKKETKTWLTQSQSESYGPRKPLVTIEADSLDDISGLTNFAEGSTANVGGTEYTLDKVQGWIVPGSGGGGGIYDEYDLIVRMDYYFDQAKMKPVLLSITPSLDDAWEIYKDISSSMLTLIVARWGSAEKNRIEERSICNWARLSILDEFAPGGATYYIEGSKTTSIHPDGSTGYFEYTSFEYDSSTGELNIPRTTSYIVSITKD